MECDNAPTKQSNNLRNMPALFVEGDRRKPSPVLFAVEVELDTAMVEDFLSEVVVMRKFNHPNVMKLLGVTVHEDKPCIILPLMMTDLKHYLKRHKQVSCFLQKLTMPRVFPLPSTESHSGKLSFDFTEMFRQYSSIILFGCCSRHGIPGQTEHSSS